MAEPHASRSERESSALEHSCADTRLYLLVDVTVHVRLFQDGRIGGVRDSKAAIVREARESVEHEGDVVCDGCGWMGRWL